MSILVLAEHDNTQLKSATAHVVSAGLQLGEKVNVLVIGSNCQAVADSAAALSGVEKVLLADNECYQHQLAENTAALCQALAVDYDYILVAASTTGKNVLPRLGALLDSQPLSDVIKVLGPDSFERPIYAGNVIASVKLNESKKLLSIRTTAFDASAQAEAKAPIENVDQAIASDKSEFVGEELAVSERPELTSSSVVVSGGRGMQNGENFELLYTLADKLGGAVGASRAAVDAGFVPNDMQVGQTGKIVAPDLYIAVGISGAIQHLAGMKDSKVIVAINKDEDAPIFSVADYGLVADLFDAVPEINQKL